MHRGRKSAWSLPPEAMEGTPRPRPILKMPLERARQSSPSRQKRQLRRLLLRPLNLCRRAPQHQIFAEYFNLVCQTLAADFVGRVDVRGEAIASAGSRAR